MKVKDLQIIAGNHVQTSEDQTMWHDKILLLSLIFEVAVWNLEHQNEHALHTHYHKHIFIFVNAFSFISNFKKQDWQS